MAKLGSTHKVNMTQEYFIDTSVWLLLNGNLGNYKKEDQKFYSSILSDILTKNCGIIVTNQVISEFSNVCLKKSFKDWATLNNKSINEVNFKKDFLPTPEYASAIAFITNSINSILALSNVIRLPDNFNAINIQDVLARFKSIDYNDSYYIQQLIERNSGTIILSNDKVFYLISPYIDLYTNK